MSKTDYKKKWRKEQDQNKILTDHINNNLITRLRRAELVLYGIVFDEVDIPLMKEEYFKSNPEAKKLHEQAVQVQKEKNDSTNPESQPARDSNEK